MTDGDLSTFINRHLLSSWGNSCLRPYIIFVLFISRWGMSHDIRSKKKKKKIWFPFLHFILFHTCPAVSWIPDHITLLYRLKSSCKKRPNESGESGSFLQNIVWFSRCDDDSEVKTHLSLMVSSCAALGQPLFTTLWPKKKKKRACMAVMNWSFCTHNCVCVCVFSTQTWQNQHAHTVDTDGDTLYLPSRGRRLGYFPIKSGWACRPPAPTTDSLSLLMLLIHFFLSFMCCYHHHHHSISVLMTHLTSSAVTRLISMEALQTRCQPPTPPTAVAT